MVAPFEVWSSHLRPQSCSFIWLPRVYSAPHPQDYVLQIFACILWVFLTMAQGISLPNTAFSNICVLSPSLSSLYSSFFACILLVFFLISQGISPQHCLFKHPSVDCEFVCCVRCLTDPQPQASRPRLGTHTATAYGTSWGLRCLPGLEGVEAERAASDSLLGLASSCCDSCKLTSALKTLRRQDRRRILKWKRGNILYTETGERKGRKHWLKGKSLKPLWQK